MKLMKKIVLGLIFSLLFALNAQKLRVGITLHPYYSYVANVVGDAAEVVPLVPSNANSHAYTPTPDDIKRATTIDVLVVNGIGHDEFAFQILKAAGKEGKIPVIYANAKASLIPVSGNDGKRIVNPHTFIGVQSSIHQIYNISSELQKIDPKNAATYRKNTSEYVRKLRQLKAKYMKKIAGLHGERFKYATLHGGYDYLLQEFGLHVCAVVEPAHGVTPTAAQLKDTIDKIKRLKVDILFTEAAYESKITETIERDTGVKVAKLSHLTQGEYSKDSFEKGIEWNLEQLSNAVIALDKESK